MQPVCEGPNDHVEQEFEFLQIMFPTAQTVRQAPPTKINVMRQDEGLAVCAYITYVKVSDPSRYFVAHSWATYIDRLF